MEWHIVNFLLILMELSAMVCSGKCMQEIPYVIDHRLMDWKELKDGSLRVEQHFIAPKQSQRQILVGKNGSKIG